MLTRCRTQESNQVLNQKERGKSLAFGHVRAIQGLVDASLFPRTHGPLRHRTAVGDCGLVESNEALLHVLGIRKVWRPREILGICGWSLKTSSRPPVPSREPGWTQSRGAEDVTLRGVTIQKYQVRWPRLVHCGKHQQTKIQSITNTKRTLPVPRKTHLKFPGR